jgi:ABC-type amino acid transport system permease subunit
MAQASESIYDELARRHRIAAMWIVGAFLLTLLLSVIAYFAAHVIHRPSNNPTLYGGLWIAILVFGLGAFPLRRASFAAMRLQDIAALRGIRGLLVTLQRTTVQLALLGAAIALMGFILSILTGEAGDMLRAGGIAAIVLVYSYPRRYSWRRVVQGVLEKGDADDSPTKGKVA